MDSLILVALITGLTAGGLSCFAVQGGLLSGSIARQVELDLTARPPSEAGAPASRGASSRRRSAAGAPVSKKQAARRQNGLRTGAGYARPILLFSLAKIAAYTTLGFLLGGLGSVFTFSPLLKGLLQLGLGVFLVGNALRMLNVHPFFRRFTFEPPARLTRAIRRLSKQNDQAVSPLFLGALTVLIPCGVTQSMIAVALGSGSAWMGAAILFAFTVGASPTFIGISWLAASLGAMFQRVFYPVTAIITLALGLYTFDTGLLLAGSPVSVSGIVQANAAQAIPPGAASNTATGSQALINVVDSGYLPARLMLPADTEVKLHLVTEGTRSCSRAFVIPDLNIMEVLPETGQKTVTIPPQAAGTRILFMCSMGMYGGYLEFEG